MPPFWSAAVMFVNPTVEHFHTECARRNKIHLITFSDRVRRRMSSFIIVRLFCIDSIPPARVAAPRSFRCSRTMPMARRSHSPVIKIFTSAKALILKANVTPPKTSTAAKTSPKRTKKVSIAAFALYLTSRLVGRNNVCRTVFEPNSRRSFR